ncbi:hypothetical protein GO003_012135 [Methylicorpusculum oleiharenae]|uniref:hypothetical protein n=1 Tax=Methylicorpusculum oleiharenae TaxID=1338687 RepID=UPI001E43A073|nr:hypothetical protein [Methylicorpusculum oleiharenae]MCD2451142.1 hypothetical protein [Methylicorpusculum oleiharenae]
MSALAFVIQRMTPDVSVGLFQPDGSPGSICALLRSAIQEYLRHFCLGVLAMGMQCPICRSHQVITLDRAKRMGGTVGAVGGAMSGWVASSSGAAMGAELGATVGLLGGPVGAAAGSVGGALMGALIGATAAGVTGAKLGQVIDQKVLHNYVCQDCGLQFGDADEPLA